MTDPKKPQEGQTTKDEQNEIISTGSGNAFSETEEVGYRDKDISDEQLDELFDQD